MTWALTKTLSLRRILHNPIDITVFDLFLAQNFAGFCTVFFSDLQLKNMSERHHWKQKINWLLESEITFSQLVQIWPFFSNLLAWTIWVKIRIFSSLILGGILIRLETLVSTKIWHEMSAMNSKIKDYHLSHHSSGRINNKFHHFHVFPWGLFWWFLRYTFFVND